MNRTNLLSVVSRLVIAVVMVTGMAAFGLSQPAEKAGNSSRYSEREAYISKLRQRQDDTSAVKTGWLILEGRLVQPPYDIQATDTSVTVNGKVVFRARLKERKEKTAESDSSATATYAVVKRVRANYRTECESLGAAVARKNALAFLLRQDAIDTAYFLSDSVISYRDTVYEWERRMFLSSKPLLRRHDPVESTRNAMRVLAERAKVQLKVGGLLIIENGHRHTIYYPRSVSALAELRKAVAMIPDIEQRKKRIYEIIGTDRVGGKIATKFK